MDRLVIQNFAQVKRADLTLGDLTVLVGPQGSGKSLALQWLKAALDGKHIMAALRDAGHTPSGDKQIVDLVFGEGMGAAWRPGHEHENHWDYLLGHRPTRKVIGLEPHSAKDKEVLTVINKKEAARNQLRNHLRPGGQVYDWLWVSSSNRFADTEKTRWRLDQSGIKFIGGKILTKHLPQVG